MSRYKKTPRVTTPQELDTQIIHMTITATKTVTVLTKTCCRIKTMIIPLCPYLKNQEFLTSTPHEIPPYNCTIFGVVFATFAFSIII